VVHWGRRLEGRLKEDVVLLRVVPWRRKEGPSPERGRG
jgi:hypothetical protein